jgi:hypothetical protein
MLFGASQVWDDLIDEPQKATKGDVNETMLMLLSDLPSNSFYREHIVYLQPIVEMAMVDWLTANSLELHGSDEALHLSFVLRDSLTYIVLACARILFGVRYAIAVGTEVRTFFHDETFNEYVGR